MRVGKKLESNLRRCKKCAEEKMRILDGVYPNKKDKRWVDTNNNQWNGSTCPDCHKASQIERMRIKRASKKT